MLKKRDFLTRFAAKLDLPREALPGSFGLTLSGQSELTVRGCKKILAYESDVICLAVGKTSLVVGGRDLFCTAFGSGSVTVTGEILSLLFTEAMP